MKINLREIILILTFLVSVQSVSAQTEEQDDGLSKRDVSSNAFTNNRQSGSPNTPKRNYKKGVVKKPRRRKPPTYKKPPKDSPIEQLGVTMWRLRSEKSSDTGGTRLLTQGTGSGSKLVGERVSIETAFRPKDKVRLSIESPMSGYLYVIDRELNKDGSTGDAYMIFPTLSTRNGDNRVRPGAVIEIPAQTDDPFYFEITPMSENYSGELLTVIVSPTKLPNLEPQNGPLKIASSTIEKWELDWEEDTAIDELEAGEGLYSASEKEAGLGKRLLTREEPVPQTRFAVKIAKGKPFLINFPMLVSN